MKVSCLTADQEVKECETSVEKIGLFSVFPSKEFGMSSGKEKKSKSVTRCDCVDRLVSYMFRQLGHLIGRKPGYFIIVPFLVSAFLATGMQRLRYEADPEYLFSPIDGPAKYERQVIEELFPMNLSTDFDVGRMTRLSPFARLMIETKGDKSIFDRDVFDELKYIDEMVRNITIVSEHRPWRYKDMCARKNRKCFKNDILSYENRLDDMLQGRYSIDYPLELDNTTFKVFFSAAFLGGVKADKFGMIESAKAVSLLYFLESGYKKKERANKWEHVFLQLMENSEFKHLNVAYYTSLTLSEELEKNTFTVLPLFSVTIVIMLAFSVSTCMMLDWVKSKPWLGVVGCLSSAVAVAGAFGLTIYCGLEFIGLNLAAPFLMLGIGMDDTFVLLAAWRRTDPNLSVPERMSIAYADAGVSITITSLTNFISFWIGVITPFPCVRIFCVYTAMAVLFTYIYHVTFFGGCMALSGYAEEKNLHSFICVPTMPKSLAKDRGKLFRLFCTGGKNPLDPDNPIDNKENLMMKFFRDKVGSFLARVPVKICVILFFLVYLGFGLWGCMQVKEGLERFKMARYDSYSLDYYDLEDKYFRKYPYRIQVIINQTLNYADPKVQEQVEDFIHTVEHSKFMAGSRFTESWLRIYHIFLKDKRTQVLLQGYNTTKKQDFYRGIHEVFFRLSKNYFKQDIKFNDDFTEIVASRFVLQSQNILDANDEKNMVQELRNIAANAPFPVIVFNQLFVFFDQFLLVRETSIQAIAVATAVMMLISFVFIPIPSCAFWVAFSISSIEIGVVGYMSWWNVNLDAISMINLILCIGFSVDYSAHITYAYISCDSTDPNEKMRTALHSLGLPIFQGSISTIIGIVVLNFAPSYIFTVFFKTVFIVILFAAVHGLLLLPVLLSLSDSLCSKSKPTETEEEQQSTPYYISSKETDMLPSRDGKPFVPSYRNLPDSNYPAEIESESTIKKYKSTATWTNDNGDLDQGIGTSGESSDGSWRGIETVSHADQLRGNKNHLTSIGQPRDSPDFRERGDHVNQGFVDDEGLRSTDRGRMQSYHIRGRGGYRAGYSDNWNSRTDGSPRMYSESSSGQDWSPVARRNQDNDPDNPLNRYMSRLNSGYVREFQLPL